MKPNPRLLLLIALPLALAACPQAPTAVTALTCATPCEGKVSGTLSVTAETSGPAPSSVRFVVRAGTETGPERSSVTVTAKPYTLQNYNTFTLENGVYVIVAQALNGQGQVLSQKSRTITVDNGPTVVTALTCATPCEGKVGGKLSITAETSGPPSRSVRFVVRAGGETGPEKYSEIATQKPYALSDYDTRSLDNGTYTVVAQALNSQGQVLSQKSRAISVDNPPPNALGFADEFASQAGWTVDADGGPDVYVWQALSSANFVDVTNARTENGEDSRAWRHLDLYGTGELGRTLTDLDSFEFKATFRVVNRSSENEWKVGRIGLIKRENSVVVEGGSEPDPVTNNINTVSFEVEARKNNPVIFFGLLNRNQPYLNNPLMDGCTTAEDVENRREVCFRRDSISGTPRQRLPIEAGANPEANDEPTPRAGFNDWIEVTCTYLASTRAFSCKGVNKGPNDGGSAALGTTEPIVLAADQHFEVDAFAIHASGRPTPQGMTPTLNWHVGRASFKLLP